MPELNISGITVHFPFEPYGIQRDYMEKVIECLENNTNAVLESPTGTGKTLSLLCSSLAWVLNNRDKYQETIRVQAKALADSLGKPQDASDRILKQLNDVSGSGNSHWKVPKIIYASRTHTQINQAINELKQSAYGFVKAVVLGSRDQLCIHPEVSKEVNNSTKIQMCKLRITTRTCSYYHRVEKFKDSPELRQNTVMDIEDLFKAGQKLKLCPYFAARELVQDALITFMPYNYLLDPKARKANKIDLENAIVILDEAHNIEKMCEEAVSMQIKSSDIALAIDDVTHVMKLLSDNAHMENVEEAKDLSLDDLALLKEMLLDLEKVIDGIQAPMSTEGITFPGSFMFELFAKANIHFGNQLMLSKLFDNLIQFLAVAQAEENAVFKKGGGIQLLYDLLNIVFIGSEKDKDKVLRCFKVHVESEEPKQNYSSTKKDGWIAPKAKLIKSTAKKINYWCFNPGFGMEQLMGKNVRSVILTSGTLAPLKPLIAELGIPISVRLENPHIVGKSQVCVKIVSCGPDKEILNSNYQNRDNPKYIASLGRTILSFCPIVPGGLLIFFPSYPLMNKCIEFWQESGMWTQINRRKPVVVEPRNRDAFAAAMDQFYANINEPSTNGACFMAVCRGKVSEGLDFADANGRAVMITGLPFPPLKDARVVLKKKYLEENRSSENGLLSGDNWYSLEATRAVNQAIGRVIRHRNDYSAILLCDTRFNYPAQRSQLSSWIQEHLESSKQHAQFGPIVGDVCRFFKQAENSLPAPKLREFKPMEAIPNDINQALNAEKASKQLTMKSITTPTTTPMKVENANHIPSWSPADYVSAAGNDLEKPPVALDFVKRLNSNVSTINFNETITDEVDEESKVKIYKRERNSPPSSTCTSESAQKKKRFKLVPNTTPSISLDLSKPSASSSVNPNPAGTSSWKDQTIPEDRLEFLKLIKNSLTPRMYHVFFVALSRYQKQSNIESLMSDLLTAFQPSCFHYLLRGLRRFIREIHKAKFDEMVAQHTGTSL